MKVLLAGISTRALACSAVSAGMEVVSLDFFGDSDQPGSAEVFSLNRDLHKPLELSALASEAQKLAPFVNAIVIESGLENEPTLQKIGQVEQRWFNKAEVVSACRDPRQLHKNLDGIGIAMPEIVLPGEDLPMSGRWLVKDRSHSGGMGVREWDGNDSLKPSEILEEFIEGTLGSACFVADGKNAVVLGLTRQYAGVSELGAPPFVWCGNVTDFEDSQLSDQITNAIQRIVSVFGLIGLNGIDYINSPLGPVLLEVNPRPPASFELFERLLGINAFQLHKDAYQGILPEKLPLPHSREVWGKGILYANTELRIANYIFKNADNIVDIPHPGEIIPLGAPICTILARDNSQSACWKRIIDRIDDLRNGLSTFYVIDR